MRNDAGTAAIAARFSFGAAAAVDGAGADAAGMAMESAGLAPPRVKRPVRSGPLPAGILTATSVGSFLDLPHQFGPRTGWYWDVVSLTAAGFTAGTLGVSKNFPLVTTGGIPYAIEPVGSFTAAGVLVFPQKGMPLLDASERLVFTVTATMTGTAQISGQIVIVPAERLDEYLS